MSLVSIILPTFNGSRYLANAIESCLKQTYSNLELIIVNDGSVDDTLSIAERFAAKDSRVRIINNLQNQQLPKCLNTGFAKAAGEYFTWISDDNYFAPHALETLLFHLKEDRLTDIVYSSYQFIDKKNNILQSFGDGPEHLLFKCIVGACFLYRRKVHEKLNGYAENKFRAEDMDFWLRAASAFRYKFIDNENLYYYRRHDNSLTSQIYAKEDIYKQYRQHYIDAYRCFFNEALQAGLSEKELHLHIELVFEDFTDQIYRDFSFSDKVLSYIDYLDKLKDLDWSRVHFDKAKMVELLANKKKRTVSLIINNLVFDNKNLAKKNPALAAYINRPISWYYREYEVLPAWYKRFGHIIKILQKNRPFN